MSTQQALWPAFLDTPAQGEDSRCATSALGTRVTFADGRTLLCATSGLWNANLGYGNRAIADACYSALTDASYLSVFRFENEYARLAATALVQACGSEHYGRVLFSTSGGAANDLAMKLARHYHLLNGQPQRKVIIALRGSYHGLTFGGFALTGEDLGQQAYGVDQRLVRHVPPNDIDALGRLLDQQGQLIAAMVVEPVLGSGTIPLEVGYLDAVSSLARRHGFLVVADEVATGFGRTGTMFASSTWSGQPDVLIASKGLTNGTCAAAAVVVAADVAARFDGPGIVLSHAETQAGTAVSCAAILATLQEFARLDAVEAGRTIARRLHDKLDCLTEASDVVTGYHGRGLFLSVDVASPDGTPVDQSQVPEIVAAIHEAGAVVHPGLAGIQLIPALTFTPDEVDELCHCIEKGLGLWSARREARG